MFPRHSISTALNYFVPIHIGTVGYLLCALQPTEKFFEMKKVQCKETVEVYRKFLTRQEGVHHFLQLAEVRGGRGRDGGACVIVGGGGGGCKGGEGGMVECV